MTVRTVSGDASAFDISFPAHPDGARYTLSISSTEYHVLYRNQTATGFRIIARTSNNAAGYEGPGIFSVMILA